MAGPRADIVVVVPVYIQESFFELIRYAANAVVEIQRTVLVEDERDI